MFPFVDRNWAWRLLLNHIKPLQLEGTFTESWNFSVWTSGNTFLLLTKHGTMGDCGVSILEDTQKPSRHDPGQTAQDSSTWAERLHQMTSRDPFQLNFNHPVILGNFRWGGREKHFKWEPLSTQKANEEMLFIVINETCATQ